MPTTFQITGMDCADCARTLEQGVGRLGGVSACAINFAAATMNVSYDPAQLDEAAIVVRVRALGYDVAAAAGGGQAAPAPADSSQSGPLALVAAFLAFLLGRRATVLPLGLGALLLLLGLLLGALGYAQAAAALEVAALLAAGYPIAWSGLRALLLGRRMTINLLMAIAAIGAVVIGEPAEAATLIVLFTLGEALEGFTAERSRDALRSLQRLAPAEALVLSPCLDCAEHLGKGGYSGGICPFCAPHPEARPVAAVAVGEIVLVRPGERVPLDGVITLGASALSQQHITGESLPVARGPGDSVFAGSINGDGALELRVASAAGESLLSRIAALVVEAQARRAPIERFVDRFASVYTPAVVVVAALVAILPPLLLGLPFWNSAVGEGWLYRALALLVVACPCALVISTPVSVASALVAASRSGALVKGGAALEALRQVRVFAFDKTGTLTTGRPHVTAVRCADACCEPASIARLEAASCDHCDDVLALAAAVEGRSAHPLAAAVMQAADARSLRGRYGAAEVIALPGRGVQGQVAGNTVTIGSHVLFDAEHPHDEALCARIAADEAQGQTTLLVCSCDDGGVRGYIAVADLPRAESQQALAALRAAGVERLVVLTGDNAAVAAAVGAAVGADEVRAGLLPAEKLAAVRDLQARYGGVAMVGDGVNDTPALAAATVGIAMGAAGSAQALEVADIALMGDDLTRLPFLVRLSQRAGAIIRQNITVSLLTKLAFLALALGGWATLWMAVVADVGVSLLVTLNGMRLLGERPEAPGS